MAAPSISLAMGTYNGARFIGEQLESLARQTTLPTELIVTDDASADGTLDAVAAFAAKAPFPVYAERNAERLGYRANFMKAAGKCRSGLIAFCDQDDVWLPDKLAACAATFDDTDTLLAYHNATVTDAALEPIGTLASHAAPRAVNPAHSTDPWSYGLGFTLMFRRELMNFMELWPQSVDYNHPRHMEAHDQWFFFLASSLGTICYLAEPYALYRQHGANACGWQKKGTAYFKNTLDNLAATAVADLQLRETIAANRARILEQMKKMLQGEQSNRAGEAAMGYRKLAARHEARLSMYASDNTTSKIRQLAVLMYRGGYRPKNHWGVGPKALVRDILCGIMFPRKATDAGK